MKVQRLIVGLLQTNCYLVWDENTLEGMIIDAGDDGDFIINKIKDLNIIPILIIATHGHFDHVLAVTELKLAFQIPFFMHRADLPIYFRSSKTDPPSMPDKYLKEGDLIKFGQQILKVIATPGHTPGGIALYSKKILFSGDTIFAHGDVGRTDYSYASTLQLEKSIHKLLKLPPNTRVYPGHGEETTIGKERNNHA